MNADAVDIQMSLSEERRCSQCRSETVPVTVDAGAGADLPLFIVGEAPASRGSRVVQVVRQPLRGQLCLNCGHLSTHARLSRPEIAEYRRQLQVLSEPGHADFISPRSPTWVKRGGK